MCNSSSKAILRPGVVHDRESIGGLHFLNIEGDVKMQGFKLILYIVIAAFVFWLLSLCCMRIEAYLNRFWSWCCCRPCRRCANVDQDYIRERRAAAYRKDNREHYNESTVIVEVPSHGHTGSVLGLVDPQRPFAISPA
jgi:hypothetical protein